MKDIMANSAALALQDRPGDRAELARPLTPDIYTELMALIGASRSARVAFNHYKITAPELIAAESVVTERLAELTDWSTGSTVSGVSA